MESKYLTFEQIPYEGKTKRFYVKNKNGTSLGAIYWYGPWRKYVFNNAPESCVFDTTCLKDITAFIDNLMLERK